MSTSEDRRMPKYGNAAPAVYAAGRKHFRDAAKRLFCFRWQRLVHDCQWKFEEPGWSFLEEVVRRKREARAGPESDATLPSERSIKECSCLLYGRYKTAQAEPEPVLPATQWVKSVFLKYLEFLGQAIVCV